MRHLIDPMDLSVKEIEHLLDLADDIILHKSIVLSVETGIIVFHDKPPTLRTGVPRMLCRQYHTHIQLPA